MAKTLSVIFLKIILQTCTCKKGFPIQLAWKSPIIFHILHYKSTSLFQPCLQDSVTQGRIYVANEYPTFARTKPMVGQKLTFSRQITLNVRQNMSFLMKNMQILGWNIQILDFLAPYCSESKFQYPTCRVVGIPKYAPGVTISSISHF